MVRLICPNPPTELKLAEVGVSSGREQDPLGWVTVKVVEPMSRLETAAEVDAVFGATVKFTVVLPKPWVGPPIVTAVLELTMFQGQPEGNMIKKEDAPPFSGAA